jgi:hypothetical protein
MRRDQRVGQLNLLDRWRGELNAGNLAEALSGMRWVGCHVGRVGYG